jgi:hypothetical protein
MKQPCQRDCPKQKPGCGATCPDWAKWEEWKKQEYKARFEKMQVADAIFDGRRRCGKFVANN